MTLMKKMLLLLCTLFSTQLMFSQTDMIREGNYYQNRALVSRHGKYGYIDENGKVVIPIQYQKAKDFSKEGFAFVKFNGQWGAINTSGKNVIPCSYYAIERSGNYIFVAKNDPVNILNYWGIYEVTDFSPKMIAPCESYFQKEEKRIVSSIDRFGVFIFGDQLYANNSSSPLLPKQTYIFDKSKAEETGLVVITNCKNGIRFDNRLFGVYDLKEKKVILDCIYKKIEIFTDNLISATNLESWGKTGVLNRMGEVVIPFEVLRAKYYEDFKVICTEGWEKGEAGVFDCDGDVILPPQFDNIERVDSDGNSEMTRAASDLELFHKSKCHFIHCFNKSSAYSSGHKTVKAIITKEGKARVIDESSKQKVEQLSGGRFNHKYVYLVRDTNGKIGYMVGDDFDLLYALSDFVYDQIKEVGEHTIVKIDNKFYLLDNNNFGAFDDFMEYDDSPRKIIAIKDGTSYFINDYNDNYFSIPLKIKRIMKVDEPTDSEWKIVADNNKMGVVEIEHNGGKTLIPCEYDEIKEGFIMYVVKKNGRYGVCNDEGILVVPIKYESIQLVSKTIAVVKESGRYGIICLSAFSNPQIWFSAIDCNNVGENIGQNRNCYWFWVQVDNGGKWGLVETRFNSVSVIIEPEFDRVISFEVAEKRGKNYIIGYEHGKIKKRKM